MTKITKRQYDKQRAALELRAATLEQMEAELTARTLEAGYPVAQEAIDEFDAILSEQWEIKQALRQLETAWTTRNWTALDWQQWELVAANID